MRALAATLLTCAVPALSACSDEAFEKAYFAVRDAQICAQLDERTVEIEFQRERVRTGALLQTMMRAGRADKLRAAQKSWEEIDAVSDKICLFRDSQDIDNTVPSIEIYRAANDALEAAIAAEAN